MRKTEEVMHTARAPTLSTSTPANGFTNSATTVAGMNAMPASSAVIWQGPWMNSGRTSVMPMNDANRQFCATNPGR